MQASERWAVWGAGISIIPLTRPAPAERGQAGVRPVAVVVRAAAGVVLLLAARDRRIPGAMA